MCCNIFYYHIYTVNNIYCIVGGDELRQLRITVSFRQKEEEKKLYNWVTNKTKVGNTSDTIKRILYEQMVKEKNMHKGDAI